MSFDPNNPIIQLCAKGMEMEAKSSAAEAAALYLQAWKEAKTDFEKFTAAHYVARQQPSIKDKLEWDETALAFALKIEGSWMSANYPSLYLNIAKCYEDLGDMEKAEKNYRLGLSYSASLPNDGYGKMISSGIENGLKRVSSLQ